MSFFVGPFVDPPLCQKHFQQHCEEEVKLLQDKLDKSLQENATLRQRLKKVEAGEEVSKVIMIDLTEKNEKLETQLREVEIARIIQLQQWDQQAKEMEKRTLETEKRASASEKQHQDLQQSLFVAWREVTKEKETQLELANAKVAALQAKLDRLQEVLGEKDQ